MPDSSSADLWGSVTLAWPVDKIAVQIDIVTPRPLNALEWVLLRVVDAFGGTGGADMPSLEEIARELGLDEPAFLRDTLPGLIVRNMLAPRSGQTSRTLEALEFTTPGRDLYRRGCIEGAPAAHGVSFYLDPLTDEVLGSWDVAPKQFHHRVHGRRFAEDALGDRGPAILGLDRVRALVREHRPELLPGDAELRAVRPYDDATCCDYTRPVEVRLTLSDGGALAAEPVGLSAAARDVFDGCALADVIDPEARSLSWGAERPQVVLAAWRRDVQGLVPREAVAERAAELVAGAREELVIDAGWLTLDTIDDAVDEAVARGLRVLVVGAGAHVDAHYERGVRLEVPASEALAGEAHGWVVVADRARSIATARVPVDAGSSPLELDVVGALTPAAARRACEARLAALPRRLVGADPEAYALAALAFTPRPEWVADLRASVAAQPDGIARAAAAQRVCARAKALAPAADMPTIVASWRAAWEAAGERLASDADLESLASLAPPGTDAADFLVFAVLWATAAAEPREALARLVKVGRCGAQRWGQAASATSTMLTEAREQTIVGVVDAAGPDVAAAIKRLEGAVEPAEIARRLVQADPSPERLAAIHEAFASRSHKVDGATWERIVAGALPQWGDPSEAARHHEEIVQLAATLRFEAGRRALMGWATRLADGLEAPASAGALAGWLEVVAALRPVLGDAARERARAMIERHAAALGDGHPEVRDAVRRGWIQAGGQADTFEGILRRPPPKPARGPNNRDGRRR